MKAITLYQPWASLIACGAKRIETLSWPTKYRGEIAIHAGAKDPRMFLHPCSDYDFVLAAEDALKGALFYELPRGAVIAIAELVDCIEMTPERITLWAVEYGTDEIKFGDFTTGRYAWILANVRPIEPVPSRGMQRLWEWEDEGKVSIEHRLA